ncbi:hypothetical protein SG34_005755 [Thalassomonas viridans]|uniref:STAS domain-containing protein n=1 Tax=Thalassomonas viridans TaxID=137584 RepID=A0AAE9Z5H1_9GAMM|nr:hypothetical protein [Thalassomonas viridans]WDE06424.1 hypothetical protein SG34_005755 [Thalassomonas viridans]
MTIYEAALLYQEITEKIILDMDIAVNLSQVPEIDTSGIQLVLQLFFLAQSSNFTLTDIIHGEASARAFELLQLDVDAFNEFL